MKHKIENTDRNLPPGVSIHTDASEEEDFPMNWEYSLLVNDRGSNSTPLTFLSLGDRRLDGMVGRMEEEKILEPDPVIPSIGYKSWTVNNSADTLRFLIRISKVSAEEKRTILDYIQSKEYPCHLWLHF